MKISSMEIFKNKYIFTLKKAVRECVLSAQPVRFFTLRILDIFWQHHYKYIIVVSTAMRLRAPNFMRKGRSRHEEHILHISISDIVYM